MYLLRERRHFWQSAPSRFLIWSSVLGIGVTSLLCWRGLLVSAIGLPLLLAVAGCGLAWFAGLDWFKVWLFERLDFR